MSLLPDLLVTDERRALRAAVTDLLADVLPDDVVARHDRDHTFARSAWEAMGRAGLLGIGIPEELGGSGGGVADSVIVTLEVARRFPSLAVDYVLCGMNARLLLEHGDDAQRAWLAPFAAGDLIISFGLSEPGGGTDLLALRTTARRDGDAWVLSGQKQWISLAHEAGLLLVLARTAEPPEGRSRARGLSLVAVDPASDGVRVARMNLECMRAAGTCEVFLDDVRAPAANLVGEEGRGFHALRATLDVERLLSASLSLGIAIGTLELVTRYVREREAFGASVGRFQAVQHPLADSYAETAAAITLVERATLDTERGVESVLPAAAKLVAGETTARVVDRGMRAMGAFAFSEDSRMQMYFRDARLQLISPVANEMVRNIIGEAVGLERSY